MLTKFTRTKRKLKSTIRLFLSVLIILTIIACNINSLKSYAQNNYSIRWLDLEDKNRYLKVKGGFNEEGLALIECYYSGKNDMKFGYVDEFGKEAIPYEYDFITNFDSGVALAQKKILDSSNVQKSVYGYVDKNNNFKLLDYDEVKYLSNGYSVVTKQNEKNLLDMTKSMH